MSMRWRGVHAALTWLITAARVSGSQYSYSVQIETRDARLVHLASYAIHPGGYFEIDLAVTLTVDTPHADSGRVMLHLIVCDSDGLAKFTALPVDGIGAPVSTAVPGYCAMANQTLGDLCESYALSDDTSDLYVYRSQKIVAREWHDDGQQYTGDGKRHFFIDACETVGGHEGVLRSCLNRRVSPTAAGNGCFFCPKNWLDATPDPGCEIAPEIQPAMHIRAAMNLCTKYEMCLSSTSPFLTNFYLGVAVAWAVTWLVWSTHIRASREAVVELQTKMKYVPIVLCAYTVMTCVMLYTEELLVGTARKTVVNLTILSQVFAMAVPAEVIILIAKGWKITRVHLDAREHQYIRFVTVAWAISFAVLKNSVVKHLTVFLIWGVSWNSVVFMVWYNSAFNLNMLLYQIAMVRQMQLDATRTPVYTKYILFRRFRGLLGIYMFASCVVAIIGVVSDARNESWRWSAIATNELLNFFLYVALGITFRCRRFSNLIQAPASTIETSEQAATADPHGPAPPNNTQATSASVAPAPAPPMPRIADIPRQKSSLVVVMNPDPNEQSLGTSFVPVNPKINRQPSNGSAAARTNTSAQKDTTSPPCNANP